MPLRQDFIVHFSPSSHMFSLKIKKNRQKFVITMRLFTRFMTTKHLPKTLQILEKRLPSIFMSKCFNEQNYPFSQEVKQTEIGHLFEHIILEFLCKGKINLGHKEAIFSGITKWDWNKDPYGTFHIHLSVSQKDEVLFAKACQESIQLLEHILQSQTHPTTQRILPSALSVLDSLHEDR